MDVKQLQDVLPQFAKKLSIQMDIADLHQNFIQQLSEIFMANKGDNTVTFEIVEFDKTKVATLPTERCAMLTAGH